MATSGNALGNNDVFNGRNHVFWSLNSQDPLDGAHGSSTVQWSWCVNWAPGDNCHTIRNGSLVINGVTVNGPTATVHNFDPSHVHTGDWPPFGGFGGGSSKIFHDANGNASITITGRHIGTSGPESVATRTDSLPQIPQTVAAPTAGSASRVSDTQASISWSNHSTSTAPYANIKVYRSTNGGGWALIATLGVVSTYTDNTISANHKYAYRMSAVGANGVEVGYATTSAIWTTPGAPTSCTATKLAGGDIRVNWTNHVGYTEYTTRIEESVDGGAFTEIGSASSGVTSFTHAAPDPAHTHTYRVRARTSSGTTLNSSFSANSNTVTLLANANPPTGLLVSPPAGIVVPATQVMDAAQDIIFTWIHNPADGTPQTKYQLQYSLNGGSTWTTVGPTSSGVSSYTLPAGTVANGQTVTWHVATAGENGTIGAYSANATFVTSTRPTVTVTDPGGPVSSSVMTAAWTYFQGEGSVQASYDARLYLGDGTTNLLETVAGTGDAAQAVFATPLADGGTYTVRVTVTSAAGLLSFADTQLYTVAFLPPAAVTVAASYDAPSGSMVLTVTGDPAEAGVTEAIATVDIQRSLDGGATWATFATGIELSLVGEVLTTTVLDTTPTIHGNNTYRAVAFSALPSSVMSSTVDVVTVEEAWAFVNYGPGFGSVCRLRTSLAVPRQVVRDRALYHFAGRTLPVMFAGDAVDRVTSVSAMLFEGASTVDEFEAVAETSGVVCWRDPTGRRLFASIGTVRPEENTGMPILSDGRVGASIGFDLTEVDYSEGA